MSDQITVSLALGISTFIPCGSFLVLDTTDANHDFPFSSWPPSTIDWLNQRETN